MSFPEHEDDVERAGAAPDALLTGPASLEAARFLEALREGTLEDLDLEGGAEDREPGTDPEDDGEPGGTGW